MSCIPQRKFQSFSAVYKFAQLILPKSYKYLDMSRKTGMKLNTLFGFLFVYLINWIGILNGANFQEEPWPASQEISLTSAEDPDVHEFNFSSYVIIEGKPKAISRISSPFTTKANGLLEYNGWGYEEFPAKGEIKLPVERNTAGNWIIPFEPYPFVNGQDYFHWNGEYNNYTKDANFTFYFEIEDADQDPMILVTDTRSWPNKKTFAGKTRLAPSVVYDPPNFFENQNLVMEFILFDPEPELEDDFSFAPTLEIIDPCLLYTSPSPRD